MEIVNWVCKRFYLILVLQKQLYIPSNPLLASFSGYVAEGNTYVIQYFSSSIDHYKKYMREFAASLNEKAFAKWRDQFISFHTVMEIVNWVCKRFYLICVLQKQLYIPSNPLLASFSGMLLKHNTVRVFVRLKQSIVQIQENWFCCNPCQIRLRRFFKNQKLKEKNFVTIEKHLNLSSLQKRLNLILWTKLN